MVLWEITMGTAYFLGLKRTYKLALKLQRKLISPKHPKIRQFVHRRTRYVFDVALRVHHTVQERDIEVGRNLGNWILRWLDKMKPEAQIRGPSPPGLNASTKSTKQSNYSSHVNSSNNHGGLSKRDSSDRHLFTAARNVWPKTFPAISMMMRPMGPVGQNTQYRRYATCGSELFTVDHGKFGFGQVLRNDIRDWVSRR
ncbi:hypothetical protein CASFOL_037013 [Castilleja foliolosa]|uniref:Uncharacterized protein n=1 Tax=Castilleja foliolosa TaxID=1961234 RepID=A0ABD3BQE4_9LAMI